MSELKFIKIFKFKVLCTICCSTSSAYEAQVGRPQFNVKESISHSDRQVTTVNFCRLHLPFLTVEFSFIVRTIDSLQLSSEFRK